MHASGNAGRLLRLMPQAPAPGPPGSIRRSAAPVPALRYANPAGEARFPVEVVANILLRLPAGSLRRFRRVCRLWRAVISDRAFIAAHNGRAARALHRERTTPTHTIVFFPPVAGGARPRPGRGIVFDERWSVTAKFTAGVSVDLVGACDGLLCFLDGRRGAIKIANPVSGESLELPPPPCAGMRHDPRAYCFGFDATARQYKIVHLPHEYKSTSSTSTGVVYVHRVGGKYWKPVRASGGACCLSTGGAVHSNGVTYWLTHYKVATARLMRFDLNTEHITSVELRLLDGHRRPLYCRLMDMDGRPCVVTSLRHDPTSGKPFDASNDDIDMWRLGEDGRWGCACSVQLRRLPRHVPGPHAMRHGHLLLQGEDGELYSHKMKEKSMVRIDRAVERLLVDGSSRGRGREKTPTAYATLTRGRGEDGSHVKRAAVVPIMGILALSSYRDRHRKSDTAGIDRHGEKARGGGQDVVRTFGYIEPVSFAPLAQYLGVKLVC